MSALSPGGASAEMERMERKIRKTESLAAATAEIADSSMDKQFLELDDPFVEDELRALKERIARGEILPGSAGTSMLDDLDMLDREPETGALGPGL